MDQFMNQYPGRRSYVVLRQIARAIRSGEYKEGTRLPTERELADLFGVSRSSVREALSILAALGIIDRRAGNGTYIRCCEERILSLILELAYGEADLKDTFELQRILEVGMAELAARDMSAERLFEIQKELKAMEEAASHNDVEAYFAADRRFHLAIAAATGNALLEHHLRSLIAQMERPLWRIVKRHLIWHRADYLRNSLEAHRQLLLAFQRRDASLARRVMEEHFERVRGEIFGND